MHFLKITAVVVLALILTGSASAGKGHTTLLATSEPFTGGVIADLYLQTTPGTGKVFIESSPLTKIDTQISTRFAKEVACSYLGKSCDDMDFFYTIKAKAAIIGGPSAGAAMAVLTVAVLEGQEANQSIALTGTINSGSVIGPVGGVPEKLEAASDAGITKVLIPRGEETNFARNMTIDMAAYGRELGIEVVEVFTLDEAVKEFTGKSFRQEDKEIEINTKYGTTMEELADSLCMRTRELQKEAQRFRESGSYNETFEDAMRSAGNLSEQGREAAKNGSNYAAASFCFGANVRYQYLNITAGKPGKQEITKALNNIEINAWAFDATLGNATTIADAQILAVVKDRIEETGQHINSSRGALSQNNTEGSIFELAFATERLQSAKSWSRFFGKIKETQITLDMLKEACNRKLAEAQERVEYTKILLPTAGDGLQAKADRAQKQLEKEEYAQCLHSATIAKAEAGTILSVYGVRDEEVLPIAERKIAAAKASIARQVEEGRFPIVGYSYYEYAGSLTGTDKYSALLFSEYALEFSNMDIYFRNEMPEEKTAPGGAYFAAALVIVAAVSFSLGRRTKRKRILVRARKR